MLQSSVKYIVVFIIFQLLVKTLNPESCLCMYANVSAVRNLFIFAFIFGLVVLN